MRKLCTNSRCRRRFEVSIQEDGTAYCPYCRTAYHNLREKAVKAPKIRKSSTTPDPSASDDRIIPADSDAEEIPAPEPVPKPVKTYISANCTLRIRPGVPNPISETVENALDVVTIEELDFSVRAYHYLKRAGINTVAQLAKMSPEDFLRVRSLGVKCTEEVQNKLAQMGLYLDRGDSDRAPDS